MGTVPSEVLVRGVLDDEPPEVLVAESVLLDAILSKMDVRDWVVLGPEPLEVEVRDWVVLWSEPPEVDVSD